MLRGLYMAGTGMLTQRKRLDVLANNIANANTHGYKKDRVTLESFSEVLVSRVKDGSKNPAVPIGSVNYGVHLDETNTNHYQGQLEYTGEPLDFALDGDGFFAVQTAEGIRFTRNGSFSKDINGYLTGLNGVQIMGQAGVLQIPEGDLSVDETGNLFVNGIYIDTLNIVDIDNKAALVKESDTLFRYEGELQEGLGAFTGQVKHGYLETSNVDISEEMVEMIAVMRNYDTNQRILRIVDDTLAKAVNEVGSSF